MVKQAYHGAQPGLHLEETFPPRSTAVAVNLGAQKRHSRIRSLRFPLRNGRKS